MTSPQPETPTSEHEERIGKYRVDPVASLFPLLQGEKYEELRVSIEEVGQLHPIIVLGDTLLDGRNRLRVCLEVGIEPRVEEYRGPLLPVDYIQVSNIDRRHLSDDARIAICAAINRWRVGQAGAKKKAAQGHHGAEGGRGKKKTAAPPADQSWEQAAETLTTDSSTGFTDEPKTRARDARSTVGQLAEKAKVSHHKATQAVAVAKAAPDLLDEVATGKLKLKDAHAQVRAMKPAAKRSEPSYLDARTRCFGKLYAAASGIRRLWQRYPGKQADLRAEAKKCIDERLWGCKQTADGAETWDAFRSRLHTELHNRRAQLDKARRGRKWDLDKIYKLELLTVLDWVERELEGQPTANSAAAAPDCAKTDGCGLSGAK